MAKLQYKDNAESLLVGAINNVDDPATFSITAGDGAKFPSLSGSQWFPIVVVDSSDNYEKMKVTARTTDSLTATRAQGGTTKKAFAIGDAIYLAITAEFMAEFVNVDDAQAGEPEWLGTAGGTADALTFTATPAITAYAAGQRFWGIAASANTGAMTIDAGGGAKALTKRNDVAMAAGDIEADQLLLFAYDAPGDSFQLLSQIAKNTLTDLTIDADKSFADKEISRAKLKDTAETRAAPASAANALTLDLEAGNVFEVTLTENVTTLTISNPPATGIAGSFTLILKQNATGNWTVTWPASVKWPAGLAPTLTKTALATAILTFVTTNAGTTWYGFLAGDAMA